jgi:Protein of unknown function (DUF2934)
MATHSSSDDTKKLSSRSRKQAAVKVDPAVNRPANADESSPETLISDIVRVDLTKDGSPPQDRKSRIAQRAYEIASERGFAPGAELQDWLQAEKEIDAQLSKQTPPEDQFTG